MLKENINQLSVDFTIKKRNPAEDFYIQSIRQILSSLPLYLPDEKFQFVSSPSTSTIDKSDQKQNLINEIDNIFSDCGYENWDGYGSAPISKISSEYAKAFIELIQEELPLPEIAPQPDGELGLEWCSANYHLALSISDAGEISYAILKPNGKNKGILKFNKFKLLKEIELFLREIGEDYLYGE